MVEHDLSPLDEVRTVLFGSERTEIDELKLRVQQLSQTVAELESVIISLSGRASAVGEVLVDAVEAASRDKGQLGEALQADVEHAVHVSARTDSVVLAEALYPVMGPALRKMIADLFTFGETKSGASFAVDQVLLIERSSGILLASSAAVDDRGDADIISGMLDAIRLFVQEAFDTSDHDGLRDLRVGETSVLVEWGPQAVLASVTRGVPTKSYRTQCAKVLEALHGIHGDVLKDFNGDVAAFEPAVRELDALRRQAGSVGSKARSKLPMVGALLLVALVLVLLLLWIF